MAQNEKQRTIPVTPRNYKEVKALSYLDLKYFCKDANIDTKNVGRDALEIILCDTMGISTTGSHKIGREVKQPRLDDHCLDDKEVAEFESLTPSAIQSLDGWQKNISEMPELDIGIVKKYLLNSNSPDFNKDSLKKYKLSRAYEHLNAKHIHSVMFNKLRASETFCVIKGQCLPSQSTDNKRVKWLHVILDKKTGEPYGGFCICTVGRGQACSHIGALLFLLCEILANGEDSLPDDSCTDNLCAWSDPKSASVAPKLMVETEISDIQKNRPTVKEYATQVAPQLTKEENYQRVLKLLFDIRNANPRSAMPPIVNLTDLKKFRPEPLSTTPVQEQLVDHCLDFDLAYSSELNVYSHPLCITEFPHKVFTSVKTKGFDDEKIRFKNSLNFSSSDIRTIESLTVDQAASAVWFEQRKAAITSSKVIRILNFIKIGTSNPDLIVKDIMQYDFNPNLSQRVPSLAWGIKHEKTALDAYFKEFQKCHTDSEMTRPDLLLHSQYPYIRESPDAVFTCSCHGSKIIEVKCPYKFRNDNLNVAIMEGKLDYISTNDGRIFLKKGHSRGYYEQILLQQVVSGEHIAELLLWSKMGYVTVHVPYDSGYWDETVKPSLTSFFDDNIIPEILTERIKTSIGCGTCSVIPDTESSDCDSETSVASNLDIDSDTGSENACDSQLKTSAADVSSIDVDIASESQLSAIKHSNTGDDNEDSDSDNEGLTWTLGCKNNCKDARAPNFSKVKGQLIACDANIMCNKQTWYHLFCEGFRRVPINIKKNYACKKCQDFHPNKENLIVEKGFY